MDNFSACLPEEVVGTTLNNIRRFLAKAIIAICSLRCHSSNVEY
jgi:hypothetical protein